MQINSILLALLFIFGCGNKETEFDKKAISQALSESGLTPEFYEELKREQFQLVAGLTGAETINQDVVLPSRWFEKDKIEARKFLGSTLGTYGNATEHKYEVVMPEKTEKLNPYIGSNIYSIIPATVKTNEYIIVGAHYDTVDGTPGASDNATGCAAVYGVGKLISQMKVRNKNLIVVFFDQEEQGPAGAFAFVDLMQERDYVIHSVHTIDQIGWDSDFDQNIELEIPTPELGALYQKQAKAFGIKAYTTNVSSSDHKEFRNAGYPTLGISEEYKNGDTSPHRHKATDTFETVDFEYLSVSTLLIFKVIESIMEEGS